MNIESNLSNCKRQINNQSPSLALQAVEVSFPNFVWSHLLKMETGLQIHESAELELRAPSKRKQQRCEPWEFDCHDQGFKARSRKHCWYCKKLLSNTANVAQLQSRCGWHRWPFVKTFMNYICKIKSIYLLLRLESKIMIWIIASYQLAFNLTFLIDKC